MHRDTGPEDHDGEDDGPSPTEDICGGGGEQSTEECAGGQDGDNEGLLGRGDGADSGSVGGLSEGAQPVTHALDASNDAGIIAEEDTTKGGEESLCEVEDGQNAGDMGREGDETHGENTGPDIPGRISAEAIAGCDCSSWHDLRKVLVWRRDDLYFGGREGEEGARTGGWRRGACIFLYWNRPGTEEGERARGERSQSTPSPCGNPSPRTEIACIGRRRRSCPLLLAHSALPSPPLRPSLPRRLPGAASAACPADASAVAQIQRRPESHFSLERSLMAAVTLQASRPRAADQIQMLPVLRKGVVAFRLLPTFPWISGGNGAEGDRACVWNDSSSKTGAIWGERTRDAFPERDVLSRHPGRCSSAPSMVRCISSNRNLDLSAPSQLSP